MTPALLALRLTLAAALLLFACGASLAWTSVSFIKRVAGMLMALLGSLLALAALNATPAAMIAGVAVFLVYAVIGVSLLVRLQEDYGVTEIAEIDSVDGDAEPSETRA